MKNRLQYYFIFIFFLYFFSCTSKPVIDTAIKFSVEEIEITNETDPYKGFYYCILKTAASGYEDFINKEVFYQETNSLYGNVYNKGCSNKIEQILESHQFTIQHLQFLHDKFIVLDYYPDLNNKPINFNQISNVKVSIDDLLDVIQKEDEKFLSNVTYRLVVKNQSKVIEQKKFIFSELVEGLMLELNYGTYNFDLSIFDNQKQIGNLILQVNINSLSSDINFDFGEILNIITDYLDDMLPPKINITYPPKDSVIMGRFALAGTISENTDFLSIKLIHKTLHKEFIYFSNEIEKNETSWLIWLGNKSETQSLYNGWDIPDGEYIIEVDVTNGFKENSCKTSIVIDNTAPVYISSNLITTGLNDDGDLSQFGLTIALEGDGYDDSGISKIFIDAYDEGKKFLGSFSVDYEMKEKGIPIAEYSVKIPLDECKEKNLAENFNLIYDISEYKKPEESKRCYLAIRVVDNARSYTTPIFYSNYEKSNDNIGCEMGNISSEIFLENREFKLTDISAKDLYEYKKNLSINKKMDEIYQRLNELSISETDYPANINSNKMNKITINPKLSPRWFVSTYKEVEQGFNSFFWGTYISVGFTSGIDRVQFRSSDICIILERIPNMKRIKNDSEIKLWVNNWKDFSNDTEDLIMVKPWGGNETEVKSDLFYSIKLDNPNLSSGFYRLVVFGKDLGNNIFFPQDLVWYGINCILPN